MANSVDADITFCNIWSRSTLFAQACLSVQILRYTVYTEFYFFLFHTCIYPLAETNYSLTDLSIQREWALPWNKLTQEAWICIFYKLVLLRAILLLLMTWEKWLFKPNTHRKWRPEPACTSNPSCLSRVFILMTKFQLHRFYIISRYPSLIAQMGHPNR